MAPALPNGAAGPPLKGTCDYCTEEACPAKEECVKVVCRAGCQGDKEGDIYHQACIDKFLRAHCRAIDSNRCCGWPCPKGKGKSEAHECKGKVQWMHTIVVKARHKQVSIAPAPLAPMATQDMAKLPPVPKANAKPKLNHGGHVGKPYTLAPPQQIRFAPVPVVPKADPLGRKLGKDAAGPVELPPGMVVEEDAQAAAAAQGRAAKKNAKRAAKKTKAEPGSDARSEASSARLKPLPDMPRDIHTQHRAMMGGAQFIQDAGRFMALVNFCHSDSDQSDDSDGEADQSDGEEGSSQMDQAAAMAQAVSPASEEAAWAMAGVVAEQPHDVTDVLLCPLAFGPVPAALNPVPEEARPDSDTEAALQASLATHERLRELADQEQEDLMAAMAASRLEADRPAPRPPAAFGGGVQEEEEDPLLLAAIQASLEEQRRELEMAAAMEEACRVARAQQRAQEEAARKQELRQQEEAAREAALRAAQQPVAPLQPVGLLPDLWGAQPSAAYMQAAAIPAPPCFAPVQQQAAHVPAVLPAAPGAAVPQLPFMQKASAVTNLPWLVPAGAPAAPVAAAPVAAPVAAAPVVAPVAAAAALPASLPFFLTAVAGPAAPAAAAQQAPVASAPAEEDEIDEFANLLQGSPGRWPVGGSGGVQQAAY